MLKINFILSIFTVLSFFPFCINNVLAKTPTFQKNNTPQSDFLLQKGQSFEKALESNQKHTYKIEIGSEQLVDLVVEQQGIDVVAALIDESGKSIFEIDSPNGNNGPEFVYCVIEKSGIYTLEVKSLDEKASLGKYKVIFNNLRDAKNEDKEEILARKLYLEGRILRGEGTIKALKASIEKYLSALAVWKKLNNLVAQEECLSFIGLAYHEVKDEIPAIKYYEEALEITKQTKNVYQEAVLLGNIGVSNHSLGEFEKARNFYNKSLVTLEQNNKTETEQGAIVLYNLAQLYSDFGNNDEAVICLKKAINIAVKNNYIFEQPRYFSFLAQQYERAGKYDESLDAGMRSLSLATKVNSLMLQHEACLTIGSIHNTFGNRQKAIEYFYKALDLSKTVGDKHGEGIINNRIGLTYTYMTDFEKAIEFYEKSLTLLGGDKIQQSQVLNNLGMVYKRQKKYEKSLDYFAKSLSVKKQLNLVNQEIIVMNNIASTYIDLQEYEKAEEILNHTLEKNKLIGNTVEEANTKYYLAKLYLGKHDYQKARTICEDSLSMLDVISTNYDTRKINNLGLLAKISFEEKKYEEVEKYVKQAFDVANNAFNILSRDEFRISFSSISEDFYDFVISFYMERGNFNTALELNEIIKVRSLTTLINEKSLDITQGYNSKKTEIQQKIASKSAILANLSSNKTQNKANKKEITALREDLEVLKNNLDLVKKDLAESNPDYYRLIESKKVSTEDIKLMMDKDTVLLEYFLGNTKSYLWILTSNSVKTFVLPSKNEIEKLVEEYIGLMQNMYKEDNLTNKQESYTKLSRSLSKVLVLPAINEMQGKRLIIVPDKILHFLPFASLLDENDLPLVVKHELVYLPSASFVVSLREKGANQKEETNKSVLIVADPVFNKSDSRISKKDTKDEKKIENQTDFELEMALRDFSNINRLPYTREEGYNIKKLFNSPDTEMLLDFDANLEKLNILNLRQFPFIHFSTHTLINEKNPELSGLLLSMVDENGNKKSGILTVNQILNLNLNADLVVLSACKTALGKPSGQEGLVGLTRSFFYAGSRKVMGSLWNVSDKGTNELMTRFYTYITKEKLKPVAALREAQKSMINDDKWSSPFYWAAFQIYGDWK